MTPLSPKDWRCRRHQTVAQHHDQGARSAGDRKFYDRPALRREDAMLATLAETFPGIDWPKQGAYFFSRVAQHGKRRAEEMREAASTVEAGLTPTMTAPIADKHEWMATLARDGVFDGVGADAPWQHYADRLLKIKTGIVVLPAVAVCAMAPARRRKYCSGDCVFASRLFCWHRCQWHPQRDCQTGCRT